MTALSENISASPQAVPPNLSRRDFLNLAGLGGGGLVLDEVLRRSSIGKLFPKFSELSDVTPYMKNLIGKIMEGDGETIAELIRTSLNVDSSTVRSLDSNTLSFISQNPRLALSEDVIKEYRRTHGRNPRYARININNLSIKESELQTFKDLITPKNILTGAVGLAGIGLGIKGVTDIAKGKKGKGALEVAVGASAASLTFISDKDRYDSLDPKTQKVLQYLALLGPYIAVSGCVPSPTPTDSIPPTQIKPTLSSTVQAKETVVSTQTPTIEIIPTDIKDVFSLDTTPWAEKEGRIDKELMAGVVNKALIEDKFAFDMHFGSMKLAIVGDEDLSQANSQTLTERRNQTKAELESEQGKRCLNQLLQVLPNIRREINNQDLNFSDCSAIIKRDKNGILQLTNFYIFNGPFSKLFSVDENGELNLDSKKVPMYPEINEQERTFQYEYPISEEYLQEDSPGMTHQIIDDPTGIINHKVIRNEINDTSPNPGDRHGAFDLKVNNLFNPEGDKRAWYPPIVMKSTIFLEEIQDNVGENIHPGLQATEEGARLFALAGDYHVPNPQYPESMPEDPAKPAVNNILVKNKYGEFFVLPMAFQNGIIIGSPVDSSATFTKKQWVELKTISTNEGVWTLMREYGKNRFDVMGFINQANPDSPGMAAYFAPYTLRVNKLLMYQFNLIIEAYGPSLQQIFP